MIDRLLNYLAPHPCCNCGKIGALLCDNCKYDITSDVFLQCVVCARPTERSGICSQCNPPYDRAWCVGERAGGLQRLVGLYKFQNTYGAYRILGDLLDKALDQLPIDTVIVPIPTVSAHIRERGYDHTLKIARHVAKKRDLRLQKALIRVTSTTQRGSGRKERLSQAQNAFKTTKTLHLDVPYLLIDDVVTTGATLHFAAEKLKEAGAKTVWVAVVARQPLD